MRRSGAELARRITLLDNLDPDDFYEIKDAIDAHELAIVAARQDEKSRLASRTRQRSLPCHQNRLAR